MNDAPELCPDCLKNWIGIGMTTLPSPKADGLTDDTAAIQKAIDAGAPFIGPRIVNKSCSRCGRVVWRQSPEGRA